MKRPTLLAGALLACACGGAAVIGLLHAAPSAPASASATVDASAAASSVLVRTAAVRRQSMAQTITVYGDVATGRPEALSFPQAGRLATLAVLPGQSVHRGELLAVLTSDPAARAAYAQAETAVRFAHAEVKRNEELMALKLATQGQLDAAAKQARDAESALAAQASLGGAQGSVRLRAPFDGVVTAITPAQGERIAAGATILQLGRTDKLRVLLAVEPANSGQLRAGMDVSLSAVQDEKRTVNTVIAEVQQQIDPKTQMVTAIVTLDAGNKARLLPGMRVKASVALARTPLWVLPRQAVLTDDAGSYLYQVVSRKARRVAVTRVSEAGADVGVEGGVNAALPVVVLGNYELEDGMAVREGNP